MSLLGARITTQHVRTVSKLNPAIFAHVLTLQRAEVNIMRVQAAGARTPLLVFLWGPCARSTHRPCPRKCGRGKSGRCRGSRNLCSARREARAPSPGRQSAAALENSSVGSCSDSGCTANIVPGRQRGQGYEREARRGAGRQRRVEAFLALHGGPKRAKKVSRGAPQKAVLGRHAPRRLRRAGGRPPKCARSIANE